MIWIIVIFISLAILFLYLGYSWEKNKKRPPLKNKPLVSVLIPTFKSKNLKSVIKSIKALKYPNIEILVANDNKGDGTKELCKSLEVSCFDNPKRLGKAESLNKLANKAKGKILFFVDSDTILTKSCLNKIVPWFSKPKVACVVPKYVSRNKGYLPNLINIESSFISTLFKIHMYFGSLIAFRGCAAAIRKDIFQKLGGWPKTQIEDNDFAAILVKNGYKIQYEPDAIAKTDEAETIRELSKQRFRWGKGSLFTFLRHKGLYARSPQFMISTLPYVAVSFAIFSIMLYNSYIYLLPAISLFSLSLATVKEFFSIFVLLILPVFGNLFALTTGSSITHFALLIYYDQKRSNLKNMIYILPYILVYIPLIMIFYIKGILSGIKDKKNHLPELDPNKW